MTSDDSATLIGQVRSNAQIQQQQQQHLRQPTQVPQQQHPIKAPPPPIVTHITEFPSQPSGTILPERQTKLVRNYKLFPGRNKFFCGGRFMTSREYWAFILALVLLIAPSVLFGIFTCPFIWENVHPAIPIVFAYLFVLTLTSMIKTSWTDPGIIPRDLDPFPVLETYDDPGSPYSSMWHQSIPTQREVRIKDKTWTLRYCETCRIYRPPRASHCRQCDNCVEVEDHHCIWLNNSPVSFVLAIVCFVLLTMVGGLTLYHCSLILRGITTHEQLRASVMTKHSDLSANPYNKGNPALNMAHVLCRPRPKSYLRRRKFSPAH
ncbi:DHHC palmitoyltransferase-domain-containing protein [Fennellomyces sp. T-0311]|nr:DHHC palmitoyltransferase-domain-containing protein [Fennellomyces sp. T-0311]